MPNVEKISVALTPEMAALVRDAVKSGEYASSSEIIREALRDWKYKRLLQSQNLDEIHRLWQEGINSGAGKFADIEAIKLEARKRLSDISEKDV
ncbi:MAG: type II toxin-antitoxin system ParD family antitoxin [Sphaerospermopsis sp.]|jgi:antitoxin ParD1/3/4|uniref:Type II toxin-antitoxin system ParD family antitoxin n=2 Tax=Sphaerospermopsis TaxID=752201 RepID=A0ABR9V904_9CYAN|nr:MULTISPECIES: type II toxin-antitoxin system ParD family antitoxin [Sphaerospermopsis]MBE9234971.1 type II toxin-antitoxin system ParD family antitoxin [Sphaerospermopsis aphanizomenoides LEGE 00250]MEB3149793.1 type II toxin-antitoxin system ParD family antitoxin [Sphaerospermopsis sp.]GCL36438.1 putative transcriptional regulators containing the CopG/Arc/MetJ DNA-binding domain protein [Sphaerospermopsis reniformis]